MSDIGLLHVYGDGKLHTLDMFNDGKRFGEPIPLPGANAPRSVMHISGTRLLLVANAQSGLKERSRVDADQKSSYLIDLPSGEFLWEADAIPIPFESIFFEELGVVVMRTAGLLDLGMDFGDHGRHLTAVDIATGKLCWSREQQLMALTPFGRFWI